MRRSIKREECSEHITHMGDMRNAYTIFVGILEGKDHLET
jgi:hypothetical protein